MKQELVWAGAFLVGAAFAVEVPIVGDKIVIDEPGTYQLSAPATVTEVDFKVPATIEGVETLTLVSPAKVSGEGRLMVPLAGADGLTVDNRFSCDTIPPDKNEMLLWSGAPISSLRQIQVDIAGLWPGARTLADSMKTIPVAYQENEDGTEATVQYQTHSTVWELSFKVKFSYRDGNTYVQILWARHGRVPGDFSHVGTDWENPSYGDDYGDVFNLNGICLCKFRITPSLVIEGPLPEGTLALNVGFLTIQPTADLSVTHPITGRCEELRFKAQKTSLDDATQPTLTFDGQASQNSFVGSLVLDGISTTANAWNLLPAGETLVLTNCASYTTAFVYGDGSRRLLLKDSALRIGKDCQMSIGADWAVDSLARILTEGGTLKLRAPQYVQDLTLSDGAQVIGTSYRNVGNQAQSYTRTVGAVPCVMEVPLRGYNSGNNTHYFELDADLDLRAGMGEYGKADIAWVKRGPAKLTLGGNGTGSAGTFARAHGALTVEAGTVAFGCVDALSQTNAIVLAGGMLDLGTLASRLGTLSLTADSTLVAGTGAVTFADSKAMAWDGKLSVTGAAARLETGHIRFLDAGLTEAQLKPMRYNGRQRIAMDADGWLTSYTPGLMVIVK